MKIDYFKNFTGRLLRVLNLKRILKKNKKLINEEKKKIVFYNQLDDLKKSQQKSNRKEEWVIGKIVPFLRDKTENTYFDPHYTYHPAWAARILKKTNPKFHIDISSTINFCSIVSAFIPIHFYDYRPADIKLENLKIGKADLLSLPFEADSVDSISCMHTVEHVGLGRYGDPIDFDGDIKAMKELQRVLKHDGTLLFVVPMGIRRIEFNAHRIYNYQDIINAFDGLRLVEFSFIADSYESDGILLNPAIDFVDSQDWGCGLFWFSK